jgi:hypothetical protein
MGKNKKLYGGLAREDLVAFLRMRLGTDLTWAYKGLELLIGMQDEWERRNNSSRGQDRRGVNKVDAPMLTRLWKLRKVGRTIFRDEEKLLMIRMQKYAKQLVDSWGDKLIEEARKYYGLPAQWEQPTLWSQNVRQN